MPYQAPHCRVSSVSVLFLATVAYVLTPSVGLTQELGISGQWTLDREHSQSTRDVGFDWTIGPAAGAAPSTSTRERRGSRGGGSGGGGGGTGALIGSRESAEDAQRLQLLTNEVRNPTVSLTLVDRGTAVVVTDERGQSRTFHPDNKDEELHLGDVPVSVLAKREAGQLVVRYKVEQGRELLYTYARTADPAQLLVDVQFVQRNAAGDHVRLVYRPSLPTQSRSSNPAPNSPSSVAAPPQTFNQQPGAPLKGLTTLGLVVEELSPQASACGLSRADIEAAVSARLSQAGFHVLRNTDEDTYLYVTVMTSHASNDVCVSRYDAFLYTHTVATLPYQHAPVLVEVSLFHNGGLVGGGSASHGNGVVRGLQEYIDQCTTRIRDANK